jgi:ligand-binding sensor domain-containing protein
MEDSKGIIWVGTFEGLTRYSNGEFTKQVKKDGSPREIITCITEDSQGRIWVGSNFLYSFDGNVWTRYTEKSHGMYGVGIIFVKEDSQHNIWVASVNEKVRPGEIALLQLGVSSFRHGAIARFDGSKWHHYNKEDGFPSSKKCVFGSYLEDSKGNIWLGAINHDRLVSRQIMYGSLMKYDGENWIHYSHNNGLNDDFVYRVIEDSNGNIWIGTHRGVNIYDGISWRGYTQDDQLIDNWITVIKEDSKGNIWIGTIKGLSVFDGKSWVNYTQENGLADNIVQAIHEDQNGNIWIGTGALFLTMGLRKGGGVSKFDGENWTIYTKEDELLGKVYWIEEDSKGNLWFITERNGISKYTP